jgi:hypothetical protein
MENEPKHDNHYRRDITGGYMLKRYIKETYDTGFLTPEINFALACAAYVLAALGFIFGA